MRDNDPFDALRCGMINLQFTLADFVHQVNILELEKKNCLDIVRYNTYVVDVATRHLIHSVQSALSDLANE